MPVREQVLDLCDARDVDRTVPEQVCQVLPGRALVNMHPTTRRGSLYVPENGNLRADVGTVWQLRPGKNKSDQLWLTPGDVVVTRPYTGAEFDGERFGSDFRVCLFGVREHLWDVFLMVWIPDFGWSSLGDWVLIERDPMYVTTLILPDTIPMAQTGTVVTGGDSVCKAGDKVFFVVRPSDRDMVFTFGLDGEKSWLLVNSKYVRMAVLEDEVARSA